MSTSKRKGTAWESAIVQYLRDSGSPHVERRALNGSKDRGDIAGIPGLVIEAKAGARLELAGWADEAEQERANDGADLAVVWAKRRGKTSPAAGYAILTGEALVQLLTAAGYIATSGDALQQQLNRALARVHDLEQLIIRAAPAADTAHRQLRAIREARAHTCKMYCQEGGCDFDLGGFVDRVDEILNSSEPSKESIAIVVDAAGSGSPRRAQEAAG